MNISGHCGPLMLLIEVKTMKLLFVSDLHGSGFWADRMVEICQEEKPDKLILLGDLQC